MKLSARGIRGIQGILAGLNDRMNSEPTEALGQYQGSASNKQDAMGMLGGNEYIVVRRYVGSAESRKYTQPLLQPDKLHMLSGLLHKRRIHKQCYAHTVLHEPSHEVDATFAWGPIIHTCTSSKCPR